MKIKINGKPVNVKSVSELTFKEFNETLVKREIVDLADYLAVFAGMKTAELLNSEVDSASLPLLYVSVFNCEIDRVLSDKKNTIEFRGKYIAMESIGIDTFGKSYMFELMRMKYDEGIINHFELCVYALAVGLSSVDDYSDVDDIYSELKGYNWRKILPQAFFLAKRTKMPRIKRLLLLVNCTWGLRATRLKIHYLLKKLIKSERRSLSENSVEH